MFPLVSLSKKKKITRVAIVSFVLHLYDTPVILVSLVLQLCRTCVAYVALLLHFCNSYHTLVAPVCHECGKIAKILPQQVFFCFIYISIFVLFYQNKTSYRCTEKWRQMVSLFFHL